MAAGNFWLTDPRPWVVLAPLDGYTDSAFRQLVKEIEPRTIVVSEMLSADALVYDSVKTKHIMAANLAVEAPYVVQIFGKVPAHFTRAAALIEASGAQGIDINIGCPARKVVNSGHGAALMRDPELAARLVEAAKKGTTLPVSVKTRLGWQDSTALPDFVRRLIDAGADLLTIHGRTFKQGFTGVADWEPIYAVQAASQVPIIGNGDLRSGALAAEKLRGLDGVMVGRAAMGNPWIMKEVAAALLDKTDWTTSQVGWAERLAVARRHAELLISTKGKKVGTLEIRKHLVGYIRGIPAAANFRSQLVQVESLEEITQILAAIAQVVGV